MNLLRLFHRPDDKADEIVGLVERLAEAEDEWRPCVGYSRYSVARDGRVISHARKADGHILKWVVSDGGYPRVAVRNPGDRVTRYVAVHKLVCMAFHGPAPSPHHEIAHNDGNSLNPHADNLRWATRTENERDKIGHGTLPFGSRSHRSKLTEDDVQAIRGSSESSYVIAPRYGITASNVRKIRERKSWVRAA